MRDGETHCYGLDHTVVPPVSGEIFWALDHYPRLREVLDAECQVVASTPEVKVYAISGGR